MTDAGNIFTDAAPQDVGLDAQHLDAATAAVADISGEQGNSRTVVVRDGRVVWRGADIDRRQSVWSCTKSFLSTTLGLLVGDGRCTLETRAADIYAPLAEHYPTVTLRHLATFTSGYRPKEVSADVPPFEPAAPLFAPGERFHYSWDPYLLALLLTRVAGESLADLFRRRIAEPISLEPDAWHWGDWGPRDELTGLRGVPVCGGSGLYDRGVFITARALARVGWLYAAGGAWGGRQLLSRAWIAEATRPQVPADLRAHNPQPWQALLPGRYGLYWWTNGLDRDGRRLWPAAPADTYAMQGHQNNYCFVIPAWRMVLIRLGADAVIEPAAYDMVFAHLARAAA